MLPTERRDHPHTHSRLQLPQEANVPSYSHPASTQSHTTERIFVIGGPAGCGKTTVASYLSQELGVPYLEGDQYHSAANKEKMSRGIPLTDADRWDWLISLRNAATKALQHSNAVIVTCSALKRKYRDVLRVAAYEHPSVRLHFIQLTLDEETLRTRVKARVGHYMKESMVQSQLSTLEHPAPDEFDITKIDVREERDIVCKDALARVRASLEQHEASEPRSSGQELVRERVS